MASRLCNKLQKLDKMLLVVTDNESDSKELDEVMWSFSDTSFLAHDHIDNEQAKSKVHIAEQSAVSQAVLERDYDVLLSLCHNIPVFNHHFSRIAEFVEAEEESKIAGRNRYKSYKAEGFELKMHNIEL